MNGRTRQTAQEGEREDIIRSVRPSISNVISTSVRHASRGSSPQTDLSSASIAAAAAATVFYWHDQPPRFYVGYFRLL